MEEADKELERRVIESSLGREGGREGGGEFGGKDIITGSLKRRGTLGMSYYSKHIKHDRNTSSGEKLKQSRK